VLLISITISALAADTGGPHPAAARAPTASKFDAQWRGLVGDWTGESSGEPGAGPATTSFKFELQDQILVRRDHNDFAAANGRPAFVHEGLMVIYPAAEAGQSRAVYFDSEGHVIEYTAAWSAAGDTLTFTSKPHPGAPLFRLGYKKLDARTFSVSFDIAPPTQPTVFKTHVAGWMKRKA